MPDLPLGLEHVWGWFTELASSSATISFAEIDAYSRLMGIGITPFEAGLIRRLDELRASAPQKRKQVEEQANAIDRPGKLRGKS